MIAVDDMGIGFFGTPPEAQQADCDPFELEVDVSGSDTVSLEKLSENFDSLNTQLNLVRDCLRNLGLMA